MPAVPEAVPESPEEGDVRRKKKKKKMSPGWKCRDCMGYLPDQEHLVYLRVPDSSTAERRTRCARVPINVVGALSCACLDLQLTRKAVAERDA